MHMTLSDGTGPEKDHASWATIKNIVAVSEQTASSKSEQARIPDFQTVVGIPSE
jgi:hypothetical protein